MATRQEIEAQIAALSENDSYIARQRIRALQAQLAALSPSSAQQTVVNALQPIQQPLPEATAAQFAPNYINTPSAPVAETTNAPLQIGTITDLGQSQQPQANNSALQQPTASTSQQVPEGTSAQLAPGYINTPSAPVGAGPNYIEGRIDDLGQSQQSLTGEGLLNFVDNLYTTNEAFRSPKIMASWKAQTDLLKEEGLTDSQIKELVTAGRLGVPADMGGNPLGWVGQQMEGLNNWSDDHRKELTAAALIAIAGAGAGIWGAGAEGAGATAAGGGLTAEAAGSTAAMTPEAFAAAEAAGFGTTGTAASVGLGTEALGGALTAEQMAGPVMSEEYVAPATTSGETLLTSAPVNAPAAVSPAVSSVAPAAVNAIAPAATASMTPLQQLGVSAGLMGLNSVLNPAPDVPAAPDPAAINQAQTEANLAAARETNIMNNPNLINQYGTQTFTEPTTPGGRATMTQTLSPEQQALFDLQTKNQMGFGNLAGQGLTSMQGLIGSEFDISGAPAAPGSSDEMRQRVIDAMMSRTNKSLGYQNEAENAALIAAGIRPGTEAYRRVQEQQGYNRNDALMQAEQAAGQEASRSFGMDTEARKNAISELLTQRQTPFNEVQALMSGSQVSNPFAGQGNQPGATVQPTNTMAGTNMLNQYNQDVYNQQMGTRNANTAAGTNLLSAWMAR